MERVRALRWSHGRLRVRSGKNSIYGYNNCKIMLHMHGHVAPNHCQLGSEYTSVKFETKYKKFPKDKINVFENFICKMATNLFTWISPLRYLRISTTALKHQHCRRKSYVQYIEWNDIIVNWQNSGIVIWSYVKKYWSKINLCSHKHNENDVFNHPLSNNYWCLPPRFTHIMLKTS